ncbi:MAG: M3 family metallopeptidase [Bacteroidota bacterium]
MRTALTFLILMAMVACNQNPEGEQSKSGNPFFTQLNEPVQYAAVTHEHISEYAEITLKEIEKAVEHLKSEESPGFDNVFVAYDNVVNELTRAMNNCFMLYWVSPDSLSREKGLECYQLLESLANNLSSDADIFRQMIAFTATETYKELTGHRKIFVDDVIQSYEHAGVNLPPEKLERFRELMAEISELSSQYSINMNTANEMLVLDEAGAEGLPDSFKESYRAKDSGYEIPVMPATRRPVLNNASSEATRKSYMVKYQNRGWEKNLGILDEMVSKRHELAQLMNYRSYAEYTISQKMAKDPETVWGFLNDLIDRSKAKAVQDHQLLVQQRNRESGSSSGEQVNPWDVGYYTNQLLISKYQVDHEVIREYLPMDRCLNGMLEIYEELLGVKYNKVRNPSVWHEDVLMYEVEAEGSVIGRFYLDLYPRPNKESWFYGVGIAPGRQTESGYEIPVCMLLANFPAPTERLPSLLSHGELTTLFHEFGHIMDNMSYNGEFASQSGSKDDFVESMSQLFENWIWDYDMLSRFARHHETGELLPGELFDNMLKAKNITSGLDAQRSLRSSVYDMVLYDRYDPSAPVQTDALWKRIDEQMALPMYVEGTHPQANWIHINTHPTYYYGYLWAEVYAQDMFTVFEDQGLTDTRSGTRYRQLIMANGTQRDIVEAVEDFLGRPSNNEAYIKSLGL